MDEQLLASRQAQRRAHYKDRAKVLRYFLLGKSWFRALKALDLGMEIHVGLRKDKVTPEYLHQIEIALYITTLIDGLLYPEDTIITVLLHDTPEDYPHLLSHQDVRLQFGERVGQSVYAMDKNGKTEEAYFAGLAADPIASVAKGGDRSHNIRTMPGVFTFEKQLRYKQEVRDNYLPMLKFARRKFPEQTNAYENIKHVFLIQIELLDMIHELNAPEV